MPRVDEKGQTLLVILAVMVIALGVGISTSSRYISNLRSVVKADNSTRALAVAEAGVERILIYPITTLQSYINTNSCGDICNIQITGADGVVASAHVTLADLGKTSDPYLLELETNQFSEINLKGYPNGTNVYVCWDESGDEEDKPSVIANQYYGNSGNYTVASYAYNSSTSIHSENGFSFAEASNGHQNCFTVAGKTSPQLLRLKAVYNKINVWIIPEINVSLPSQGILITSEGKVADSIRKVSAIKSEPVLPSEFDQIIYSKSLTDPLSN